MSRPLAHKIASSSMQQPIPKGMPRDRFLNILIDWGNALPAAWLARRENFLPNLKPRRLRSMSAGDKASCLSDQPKHMPPLARSFPHRACQWAMIWEDQAKGEIARRMASVQRVMDTEKLDASRPLIDGRMCGPVGGHRFAARHALQSSNSRNPQRALRIAGN